MTPTESQMQAAVKAYFDATTDLESEMALSLLTTLVGALVDDLRVAQTVRRLNAKPSLRLVEESES